MTPMSSSSIPSDSGDLWFLGTIRTIDVARIGRIALSKMEECNCWSRILAAKRCLFAYYVMLGFGSNAKRIDVKEHLNIFIHIIYYLMATDFGIKNVLDEVMITCV